MDRKNEPFAHDADLAWEPAGEGVTRKILTYREEIGRASCRERVL